MLAGPKTQAFTIQSINGVEYSGSTSTTHFPGITTHPVQMPLTRTGKLTACWAQPLRGHAQLYEGYPRQRGDCGAGMPEPG